MSVTAESRVLRETIAAHREELDRVLRRYRARNPRLFGSVARGDAMSASDIDVLVDLEPEGGNALMRVAGLGEEFSRVLDNHLEPLAATLRPQ
ncbi:nucleotidyltransferase family protein [Isoptericola sp. BMS4]|uniref:nucleotidyltransferase family protein n=1 Tax=Isoptericola sp. BMS4 TaxID=2527875 RepID=UPI001422D5A7|nr:nucleotidyltransferase domain-containing protein [Isoptericola sp. BMS4]